MNGFALRLSLKQTAWGQLSACATLLGKCIYAQALIPNSSQITFTKPTDMHRRQKYLGMRFATAKRRNNEALCSVLSNG